MGGEIVIMAHAVEDKPATHNRALLVRNNIVLTDSTCVTRAFGTFLCRPRNNRDFKIQYGEAPVRLMQRKETGPTTPSPAKTQID